MVIALGSDQTPDQLTRREQLVTAAARLFAERGFHGVTVEDLGGAVGISGPGFYRHFVSKDAVLAEMLIGISEHLLEQGTEVVDNATSPSAALDELLIFHTDFALTRPELIRVHDRDLANLPAAAARRVRRLQRSYVELWVVVLTNVDPTLSPEDARTRAHAVFGLLNSTPHSAAARDALAVGPTLRLMAHAALSVRA
jgi:AcrR family transcriptional regulator